ncbi:ZIP family metal transporter [Candidatus Acetothermia bacterium]|nr:ZIP family metal transporter [Candidatus Acetothermia bacterium]MBI3660588.1 ZIP family metal transporter [Candidatus Acetothermia bacterium]
MSFSQLLLVGAIAGFTVYLGLPVAALRRTGLRTRGVLNGIATGILVYLMIEILKSPLGFGEDALEHAIGKSSTDLLLLFSVLVGGVTLGLVGIPILERWMLRQWARSPRPLGIVAQTVTAPSRERAKELQPFVLALMISAGIGLHNFSEGLAIGQQATLGHMSLAWALIIGFALHNITEGFGIAAPLAGTRPSLGFLALAGLIAGGPTFLGTVVGASWQSPLASIAFLALAGGALLYVISELLRLGHAMLAKVPFMLSLSLGFFIGYFTELVLERVLGG